jgi:hypothetical protein
MKHDAAQTEAIDIAESDISPRDQVSRLISDFRLLANAEIDYYRARFAYGRSVAKWTGLYVALTLFAVFGVVVALILGLLMALSDAIGPLAATACITIGFAIVAFVFAVLARRSGRNFAFPELHDGPSDE